MVFGSVTLTNNLYGNGDLFVSKLDSNGTVIWAKNIRGRGTEAGHSLALDANDHLFIAGVAMSTVSIPFGNGTLQKHGTLWGFLLTYNASNGNELWGKSFGGSSVDVAFTVCNYGNALYVSGYFTSPTIDFDGHVLSNSGGTDAYLSKIKWPSGTPNAIINISQKDFSIYPNPSTGFFQVILPSGAQILQIWNCKGQKVQLLLVNGMKISEVEINEPGIYFVQILGHTFSPITKKLIIAK